MANNQQVSQQAEAAYSQLLSVFPSAHLFHQSPSQRASVDQTLVQPLQKINNSERATIFEKLRQFHKQSISTMSQEMILYVEQQLSDIYGLTLTTESKYGSLPFLVGQVQAQSHLKQSPTDELTNHLEYLEADLRPQRGYFGWSTEKYGVTVPLHDLPKWSQLSEHEKQQFSHQQVVIINPVLERAVLAKIVDVGPYHTQRYQLGATPQVIRGGKFWAPSCSGLAALFFVESSSASLKTGLL